MGWRGESERCESGCSSCRGAVCTSSWRRESERRCAASCCETSCSQTDVTEELLDESGRLGLHFFYNTLFFCCVVAVGWDLPCEVDGEAGSVCVRVAGWRRVFGGWLWRWEKGRELLEQGLHREEWD